MTKTSKKFELSFWGGSDGIQYKRNHATIDAARNEALKVLAKMEHRGAHMAIIYDDKDNQVECVH